MPGEKELNRLLQGLDPVLDSREFVFCLIPQEPPDVRHYYEVAVGFFRESEGLTLILDRQEADRLGLEYEICWRMITLHVYSSLEAVGLIAAVSRKLADAGLPANPVSAFHHDHLFVPADQAETAVEVLKTLARSTKDSTPTRTS